MLGFQFLNEPRKSRSLQRLRREAPWQNERLYGRCSFLTSSGRMMMIDPLLQHVPKRFHVESTDEPIRISLRKMFVARTGFQLFSFDFSQLELRILASLSNDENLKKILVESEDFFRSLASNLFRKSLDKVTEEQRQSAKKVFWKFSFFFVSKR